MTVRTPPETDALAPKAAEMPVRSSASPTTKFDSALAKVEPAGVASSLSLVDAPRKLIAPDPADPPLATSTVPDSMVVPPV